MRLITRCSDVDGTARLLINLGTLDILLKLIPTCFKHAEGYGADLMRTLSNILPAASPETSPWSGRRLTRRAASMGGPQI